MNKKRMLFNGLLPCIIGSMILSACFSPWKGGGDSALDGALNVSIGGPPASRTLKVMPWGEEIETDGLIHTVTITSGSGDQQTKGNIKYGETAVFTEVPPGSWEVLVQAFLEGGEVPIAEGISTVDVKSGANASVTISMDQGLLALGYTLAEQLEWLRGNARGGRGYVLQARADEEIGPCTLDSENLGWASPVRVFLRSERGTAATAGTKKITLNGSGGNSGGNSRGPLFTIGAGVTLIMSNVSLQGQGAESSLIRAEGGALVMEEGATVGGTVSIETDGAFAMNGGTINGHADIWEASFSKTGGTISGEGEDYAVYAGSGDGKKYRTDAARPDINLSFYFADGKWEWEGDWDEEEIEPISAGVAIKIWSDERGEEITFAYNGGQGGDNIVISKSGGSGNGGGGGGGSSGGSSGGGGGEGSSGEGGGDPGDPTTGSPGSFTVTLPEGFENIVWYYWGSPIAGAGGEQSITISADDYTIGFHTIVAVVTAADGIPYSHEISFTVAE